MTGVTSPTVSMNENGIGSGAIVSKRRNRNWLCPMDSRIVVVENQARTSAIRKTSASITTMRVPLSWSAASLARTIPAPVKGEPLRRMAGLVEVASVHFVETGLGKADAGQLGRRSENAGDLGPQIALAISPIELRPHHLHSHHTRHASETIANTDAANLDVDYIAAAEYPLSEVGHAARQRDPSLIEQRHPVAHALHLIEMVRRQQDGSSVVFQGTDHTEKFLRRMRVQGRGRLVENRDPGPLHQNLGEPEPLAHTARKCPDPFPADIGKPDPGQRVAEPLINFAARQTGQPPGIGKVVMRRQTIVEADRIGQVADPTLDLERLAQRVESGDLSMPFG